MNAPTIARILGLLFLIAGIIGFVPLTAPPHPPDAPVITLDAFYGFIFGLFPANAALNAFHVLFGVWGFVAASRFGSAVTYLRAVAWIYGLLAILGALPVFAFFTLFGVAPIYGWDVLLHAVVALVAAYGGYGRGSIQVETTPQ